MTDRNTFSALLDEAVRIAGRGQAQRPQLISYIHSSMRECRTLHFFDRDRVEDTITADAKPFVWTTPRYFRIMETVRYPYTAEFQYPKNINPNAKQLDFNAYYYRGPNYFVFSGVNTGDEINVSYFTYGKPFAYYDVNSRPARYSIENEAWEYLDNNGQYVSTLGTAAQDEAAQAKVTNWLIDDWFDLVLEGTLAKIFKVHADQRSATHFALFKQFQKDLSNSESKTVVDG